MTSDTTSPSAAPEPSADAPDASQTAPAAEVAAYTLSRDPATLRQQLRDLQHSDPDFANVFGDLAGRYVKRTWEPQVNQLKAELEAERTMRERLELEKMDPEEIERRFANDPSFATKYAKLVHYQPPQTFTPEVDEESIREDIRDEVNSLFSWAKAQNLPDEVSNLLRAKAASGGYDQGESLTEWRIPFQRLHQDVVNALLSAKATPAPVVEVETTKVTNPTITRGGPDLTSSHPGSDGVVMPKTTAEFNALPRDVQKQLISTPEGYAAVLKLP